MPCALCLQDKELRRSHIIPEFLYEMLYDDFHRFHVLSATPEYRDRMEQKGLREYLLCDNCETTISRWEDYARGVLVGGLEVRFRRVDDVVVVEGIDYKRFKLFQLSILWRSGVSKLPMFGRVKLGPHNERQRSMLMSGDPGSADSFGCVMFGLRGVDGDAAGLIAQPMRVRIDGHTCYRFIFGGFMWVYFLPCERKKGRYARGFLTEEGGLAFLIKDIFNTEMMARFALKRSLRKD